MELKSNAWLEFQGNPAAYDANAADAIAEVISQSPGQAFAH